MIHLASEAPMEVIALPVLLSYFRDEVPWAYELGMEAYRQANAGNMSEARVMGRSLLNMIEHTNAAGCQTPGTMYQ